VLKCLTRVMVASVFLCQFAVDAQIQTINFSDASCSLYPGCAGLPGDCCPNVFGHRLSCCDVAISLTPIQSSPPTNSQPLSTVDVASCASPFGVPAGQSLVDWGVPPAPQDCAFVEHGLPVLGESPSEVGDCVVAAQRIRYAGGEEVPPRTLGTVMSTHPHIGVDWVGFNSLIMAIATEAQLEKPRPLRGKLVGVMGGQKEPIVRCLSVFDDGGVDKVRMLHCEKSEDQSFVLPPCGTGYIVSFSRSDLCLDGAIQGFIAPCNGSSSQVFKLRLAERQLQGEVGEESVCYDLGGRDSDQLVEVPCDATSTKFMFAEI